MGNDLCGVDDVYLWKAAKKRALLVGGRTGIFELWVPGTEHRTKEKSKVGMM